MSLKSKISGLGFLLGISATILGIYDGINSINREERMYKELQRGIKRGRLTGFSNEDIEELKEEYREIKMEERDNKNRYLALTGSGLAVAIFLAFKKYKD
jgi:hypothetical protein